MNKAVLPAPDPGPRIIEIQRRLRIMITNKAVSALIAVAMFLGLSAGRGNAQLRPMGPPLPTTLVVSLPAPGEVYGDKPVITVGVGSTVYRFLLKDAYVDDPSGFIHWPDIWQYVRMHRPNFQTQGADADQFKKIKPGQTVTIKGMFAPLDRTFEVVSVAVGPGVFAPGHKY
jgi:hypothetical protein